MRPSNKSRSRNKSGNNPNRRPGGGNIVNRVFESAGPDGKVRGTPQQIIDKYQALTRDAQVSGDRVVAESYLQHAEHYTRLLSEAQRQMQESRPDRDDRDGRDDAQREDAQPQRERERAEAGEQPQLRAEPAQPQRQEEPSGLTTIGAEDGVEVGPVETPEETARRREAAPAMNGEEHAAAEPQAEAEPPVKRPRARRKPKPAAQPEDASAE